MSKPETIIAPHADAEIVFVPLAKCYLHDANPRQTVSEEDVTRMAEAIAAAGLLQNLCVIADKKGGFGVVAGGRRLRGLMQLAEQGRGIDPIPVRVAPNPETALQWAATENEAREALSPADEIRSYARMRDAGQDVKAIAVSFARTQTHVKQRLALACLAPVILDALAAGEITLDVASHYTITDDQERQADVFGVLHGSWHGDDKRTIHARLVGATDWRARNALDYVGKSAYLAAGGIIHADLFGEAEHIGSPELLSDLAAAKLADDGEALRIAEGWKWVETRPEGTDYDELRHYPRLYPAPVPISAEDEARFSELEDMDAFDTDDETLRAEYETLSERINRELYSPDQIAVSGLFVDYGSNGELGVHRGLIRPDDCDDAEAAGVYSPPKVPKPTAGTEIGPKPTYSAKLTEDLSRLRTAVAQKALANDPTLALDLLTFVLADGYLGTTATVAVSARTADNCPREIDGLAFDPTEIGKSRSPRSAKPATIADRFAAFRQTEESEKAAIRANHVARALCGTLSNNPAAPLFEAIAGMAGADLRAEWTPSIRFFEKLSKAALIEIAEAVIDEPAKTGPLAKGKKGEVADMLARIFAAPEKKTFGFSEDQIARIKAWTPKHVGFAT